MAKQEENSIDRALEHEKIRFLSVWGGGGGTSSSNGVMDTAKIGISLKRFYFKSEKRAKEYTNKPIALQMNINKNESNK